MVGLGLLYLSLAGSTFAQDSIEFINGSTMNGEIIKIREEESEIDFLTKIGSRSFQRTYPFSKIRSVTQAGKKTSLDGNSDNNGGRTRDEVLALIESVGSQPPKWLESTELNHPQSLELNWPLKSPGPWNESKNVGQYIWGRVNPNEGRWKPGLKLVYQCMKLHQGNHELLSRDMQKLGDMYFTLFRDYSRAAFWLQKSDATAANPVGVYLAECYWRLGNRSMALSMLDSEQVHFSAIKLFGDMGEIDKALAVTDVYSKTRQFNEAFLNAGDALRGAGRFDEAITYYQQVIDRDEARNQEYLARFKGRASDAIEAIRLFDRADVRRVADGTYTASSMGYNGQVEVEVEVASAKILQVRVTKHREKQFYAALTDTPQQIIELQGIKDVDGTSGATITSQAIIAATAKALADGSK
ncbi:FMN-binding domain protein [Rubripirellula reticaptiva]|uniref:FMN-binding domain protein n=2 Tax=Rubripirellula reticaptiva TaxID=2528013 RepID=A0A5C6EWL6_9BACT|nr:FMN-binding domain protein [Rubripirellula reticaptiva]